MYFSGHHILPHRKDQNKESLSEVQYRMTWKVTLTLCVHFIFISYFMLHLIFYSIVKITPCVGWNYWQRSFAFCPLNPTPLIIYVFPTHATYYQKPPAVFLNIFTGKWSILSMVGTRHWLMAGNFGFWQDEPSFKLERPLGVGHALVRATLKSLISVLDTTQLCRC